MKHSIYICRVRHVRGVPRYVFEHDLYMFALDLDSVSSASKLISVNAGGIFSFSDRDHFKTHPNEKKTRENVNEYLQELNLPQPESILLVTNLRVFGYVFNPVSFYFCTFADREPVVLAEVNNTYGEQKPFLLLEPASTERHRKEFYVSPFIKRDMMFRFRISRPRQTLRVKISSESNNGTTIMSGTLVGIRREITTSRLLFLLFRYPFVTLRIIILIHWHALRLFLKGVKHYPRKETVTQSGEREAPLS